MSETVMSEEERKKLAEKLSKGVVEAAIYRSDKKTKSETVMTEEERNTNLAEAIVDAAIHRTRQKTGDRYRLPKGPTIGQSILRTLHKYSPLSEEGLRQKVRETCGEIYNERFFNAILSGHVRRGHVNLDESSGLYTPLRSPQASI